MQQLHPPQAKGAVVALLLLLSQRYSTNNSGVAARSNPAAAKRDSEEAPGLGHIKDTETPHECFLRCHGRRMHAHGNVNPSAAVCAYGRITQQPTKVGCLGSLEFI